MGFFLCNQKLLGSSLTIAIIVCEEFNRKLPLLSLSGVVQQAGWTYLGGIELIVIIIVNTLQLFLFSCLNYKRDVSWIFLADYCLVYFV